MPLAKSNAELAEQFFEGWDAEQTTFTLQTSGSTGQPKLIELQRHHCIWSAERTREAFFPPALNVHQLCALPLTKVGAFMQLVRSRVWNTPIDVLEPSSNPLLHYRGTANVASFTPMQLYEILKQEDSKRALHQFELVLIGGSDLSTSLEKELLTLFPEVTFIHTFGMTETYSHFAGRKLGESCYTVLPQTSIRVSENGCLQLNNQTTNFEWITTNDVVNILSNNTFHFLGRSDFTINSGGIKIQLEQVELEIQALTKWEPSTFFCWYLPDERLGQRLVLVTTHAELPSGLQFTQPYYKPTQIINVPNIAFSDNGKVIRKI